MRKGAALRGHVKGAVNVMEGAINHRWLRQVVRSWRSVVDGPSSKKACLHRYNARRDAARAALQVKVRGYVVEFVNDKGVHDKE
jgi:hypothetical protein